MSSRFPVLSALAILLKIAGWLILVPTLFLLALAVIAYMEGAKDRQALLASLIGLAPAFSTLLMGEFIGLGLAIERNTHDAAERARELLERHEAADEAERTADPKVRVY